MRTLSPVSERKIPLCISIEPALLNQVDNQAMSLGKNRSYLIRQALQIFMMLLTPEAAN